MLWALDCSLSECARMVTPAARVASGAVQLSRLRESTRVCHQSRRLSTLSQHLLKISTA